MTTRTLARWVIANLDTYDASPRALVNATQAVVVSTHYRQAPEHRYPAAHGDVFAAYQWVLKNATGIKADSACVAVVGDSAGGNMAAVTSIRARDQRVPLPVYQVLIYPVAGTDSRADLPKLPATTIITADSDPLRSVGQMLAQALERAGVQVNARNFEGSITSASNGRGRSRRQQGRARRHVFASGRVFAATKPWPCGSSS